MSGEKFIATKELGKLAKWLRILGYDTVYYNKRGIADLIVEALRGGRILVGRSPALAKYKGIRMVLVKDDDVENQIEQVVSELQLAFEEKDLFQRCVECNTSLEDVEKEQIKEKVPEYVFQTQKFFKRCPKCDKIFWKGTHWDMVGEWLKKRGFKEKEVG
jgi:uncharacterized protein with PIN domain